MCVLYTWLLWMYGTQTETWIQSLYKSKRVSVYTEGSCWLLNRYGFPFQWSFSYPGNFYNYFEGVYHQHPRRNQPLKELTPCPRKKFVFKTKILKGWCQIKPLPPPHQVPLEASRAKKELMFNCAINSFPVVPLYYPFSCEYKSMSLGPLGKSKQGFSQVFSILSYS